MGLLRCLLALTVVLSHSGLEMFVGSRNAVQVFYMVSGFLIAYVLNNEKYRSLSGFYFGRFLRIFPVYLVVLAASFFFPLYGASFYNLWNEVPLAAKGWLALSNLIIFGQDQLLFFSVVDGKLTFVGNFSNSKLYLFQGLLVPQAWSLALELYFYILAPFVATRLSSLLTLFVASVLFRLVAFNFGYGDQDPWVYRFFPFELSLFMLGCISMHVMLPIWKRLSSSSDKYSIGATFFLVAICVVFPFIDLDALYRSLLLFLIVFFLLPGAFCFQARYALDRYIGDLSYPIYICHILAISFWSAYAHRFDYDRMKITFVVVVSSLALSMALKHFVSDRIEPFRRRMSRPV